MAKLITPEIFQKNTAEDYLKAAIDTAEWIDTLAIKTEYGRIWQALPEGQDGYREDVPLFTPKSMYDGSAGIGIFFIRLYEATGDTRWLTEAEEAAAHIDPAVGNPGVIEVFGDNRRRDQLAAGHDRVVPQLGIGRFIDGLHGHFLQFVEQRVDRRQAFGAVPQVVDDLRVVFAQFPDMLQRELFVAPLQSFEHLFQRIGRLAHRRDDDEEVLLVVDDFAQVSHAVGIPHRRASEFIDLHVISFFNLTYLPYRPEATNRRTPAAVGRVLPYF